MKNEYNKISKTKERRIMILSPRIDVVFKMLFTPKSNEDILTDFLAAVLDIDPEDINDVKVLNGEILPDDVSKKFSRLDILVSIKGKKINIEMQVRMTHDYADRVAFYAAKVFVQDLESGDSYATLEQAISINILDYTMFDVEECHSTFMLKELKRDEVLTDKLRIDFLELPKTESDNSIQVKRLKKWMRFFNIKSEEDADMIAQANDTMINKAVYVLREMSADERTREIARQRERRLHDEASYMETARLEGRAEGIVEGRAEERKALLAELRALGVVEEKLKQALENVK